MNEIWLVCLAIATPIAGIFGFAIQIRTVRKVRLENEKLLLEIRKLQQDLSARENLIEIATVEQIEKYGDIRFSLRRNNSNSDEKWASNKSSFIDAIVLYFGMAMFILFVLYLLFDLYRIFAWLVSLL